VEYRFREDELLGELYEYVNSTYKTHYSDGEYQATDVIIDAGHGEGFCVGNIIRYAKRYGKKAGKSKRDMFKVIHYALISIYIEEEKKGGRTNEKES